MAKTSRFKKDSENRSKGHLLVGELLKKIFPNYRIYQEYPYDRILKNAYKRSGIKEEHWSSSHLSRSTRLKADWYVLDFDLVIEFQGEHHQMPVDYGNSHDQAVADFEHRKHLDRQKRSIAAEGGINLIEIPYDFRLTKESLQDLIYEKLI